MSVGPTDAWKISGRTSADHDEELNHYPVVVDDHRGRPLILSEHHRSTAALIAGRGLRARAIARGTRQVGDTARTAAVSS